MAKAKYITDFERDVIRLGVANDQRVTEIARFLGRSRVTIHKQIKAMRDEGTLENLPMDFLADGMGGAGNVQD